MSSSKRLALRREGAFWNAYVADMGTMDDAVLIGSICMAAIVDNPERAAAFKAMMNGFFIEICEEYYGSAVKGFVEQSAPEHERAGHS